MCISECDEYRIAMEKHRREAAEREKWKSMDHEFVPSDGYAVDYCAKCSIYRAEH